MDTILIVGSGRMARIRAEAARTWSTDVRIVFAARDDSRAARLAEEYHGSVVPCTDLAAASPHATFITSSTANHADDLSRALEAGAPILIEKPLARSVQHASDLEAAIAKSGVPVVVGFQRRFDPEFRQLHEAVATGGIGTLYSIRAASMDHTPAQEAFIAESGGIFHDLFVHDFDAAAWIAGEPIVEVYATGSCRVSESYARHHDLDVATVIATLAGGASATLQAVRHCPTGQDVRWEVYGSQDVLAAGLTSRTPVRSLASPELTCQAPWTTFDERFAQAFVAETESFLHSAASGAPFAGCSVPDAIRASVVAEACEQSVRSGAPAVVGSR